MTPLLTWFATWYAQAALLTAAGALAASMLAHGKSRLIFWQGLLLTLLLLPAVEPWQRPPVVVMQRDPIVRSVPQAVVTAAPPPTQSNPDEWLLLLAVGAALRLMWIAAGFLRLRHYRKNARLLSEPPFPFAGNSARWYASESVPGPVTYGWREPSVLLPERVMQLPSAQREAIACHELVHVRRGDWLFVLAEETLRALLWFHPAVWLALSRIQLAREHAVDSEAVRLTNDRDGYLDALVEVAALGLRPEFTPAPLFLRKRHLALRVAAVMKEVSMSKARMAARLAAACSGMIGAACVAVWLIPFVSTAQTVQGGPQDGPGVSVMPGATVLHRTNILNRTGASGVVTIEASLDANGEVTDAHVLSGPDDLRRDALSSVLQWHYAPGPTRVQISMRFDAASPATGTGTGRGTGGGVGRGYGGGIGNGAFVPVPSGRSGAPASPPAYGPGVLKNIEFNNLFTPEAVQEMRRRMPVHEGDTISPDDTIRLVSDSIRDYESHAAAVLRRDPASGDWTLLVAFRPQAEAPPSPVPGAQFIGSEIATQGRLTMVQPVYPPLAKQARVQGVVRFQIVIGKDGTVQQVQLISGSPLLVGAARDAVSQWTYKPVLLNGAPAEVQTEVSVNFFLDQ